LQLAVQSFKETPDHRARSDDIFKIEAL